MRRGLDPWFKPASGTIGFCEGDRDSTGSGFLCFGDRACTSAESVAPFWRTAGDAGVDFGATGGREESEMPLPDTRGLDCETVPRPPPPPPTVVPSEADKGDMAEVGTFLEPSP